MKRTRAKKAAAASRQEPSPRPARAFVLRFLAGALAGIAALALLPAITAQAIAHTAQQVGALGRFLGIPLVVHGDRLDWGSLHLEIVPECTPLVPMILLASAILAYPASARARLVGLATALPLLWVYNLGRVLTLALVVQHRPQWFEFVHVYLWQAVTLAACAGLFALWLVRVAARLPRALATSR